MFDADPEQLQAASYGVLDEDEGTYLIELRDAEGEATGFVADREQMVGLCHGIVMTLDLDEDEVFI